MNDELLFERLASHEEPAALDRAFEDRLYSILEREMRRGRSLRPALLLAATLVLVLTITAAIAIGSGLIKPPWMHPSLIPTPMANGLIAYPLGDEDHPLANVADIYLTSLDGTPRRVIGFEGDGLAQTCPAFSPDGALLAYGERAEDPDSSIEAAVVIIALERNGTPSLRLRIPAGDAAGRPCPKWSPDGRAVAYLAGDPAELRIAPLDGSPTNYGRLPCDPGIGCPAAFAWTFDSSAFVFAHFEALRQVPMDGSEPLILAQAATDGDLKESFEGISPSPAGALLAVSGGWTRWEADGSGTQVSTFVRVLNIDTGKVTFEQTFLGGGEFAIPAWSPDGTRIAWGFGEELLVRSVDGTPAVVHPTPWVLEGARPSVGLASGVTWSPDGRRLLFVGYSDDPRPEYAIVSIAADGPPDLRVLTPWTMGLYNGRVADLGWQAVDE
jgi:Tol biopolymer transport system component